MKNKTIAYLLWLTGGFAGHRWYLGQKKLAVMYMLTGGGLGIWTIMDLFRMDTIVNKANGIITEKKPMERKVVLTKIAVLIAITIIFTNVQNFGSDLEKAQAETPKIETKEVVKEVVAEPVKQEPVKEEVQYTTQKSFIQNDPSSYSGKSVYEISIHGQFDLDSATIKQEAMMILNKEAEIGLNEQPTSVMIRVFIYQGEGYDYLPIAVGTFDVAGSNLTLRELQDKARFPIFNQLNK
jgi:hypothetical protein